MRKGISITVWRRKERFAEAGVAGLLRDKTRPPGKAPISAGRTAEVVLLMQTPQPHERDRAWLVHHPRWTLHFTPTSSSWLNAVEGNFAKLLRWRLKHGVFCSVIELQAAINRFIAEHNEVEAKPFVWRADPDAISAGRNRGFQALGAAS